MKIALSLLKQIAAETELPPLLNAIKDTNGQILFAAGSKLKNKDMEKAAAAGTDAVDLAYNHDFYQQLNRKDPLTYKLPVKNISRDDLAREIKFISFANQNSAHQRKIIFCGELYDESGNIILKFEEELNNDIYAEKITRLSGEQYFPVRYNEYKIILLVNLKPSGDDFIRRFRLNADMTYNLIKEISSNPLIKLLSNLIPEKDILIVDQPRDLLEAYQTGDVRLILIGDAVDTEYKKALVAVKKYDPYARLMLANRTNPNNVMKFLFDVEYFYSQDKWL
ncbi:MAG TPA: hypothetical protein VKS21_05225 [Spirochaetota bacterium]|nr:hypothetical protein [Spirochaetota bacterium]